MTATPPDPFATQHDSTTDPDAQAPVDAQTLRLREENRALRELLAAQVQAQLPPPQPGCLKRIGWWLISAPGAALVGWRSLLGGEDARPITGRRVGSATLTVLYTLAIYGALVLLVVSWNAPNNGITGATAASPVRVPLMPPSASPLEDPPSDWEADAPPRTTLENAPETIPDTAPETTPEAAPDTASSPASQASPHPTSAAIEPSATHAQAPAAQPPANAPDATPPTSSGPQSTLRITEIPAQDPVAWVKALQTELARCAELGFFDRPDCAWAARNQFCEANHGWGVVKECPTRP